MCNVALQFIAASDETTLEPSLFAPNEFNENAPNLHFL